jgi:iron complex outermembrane receptor protein
MIYATYARGYKGPTINVVNGVSNAIKPETVDSFEGGVKATLLDHRLTFNLALYWTEFKNFQAQAYDFSVLPLTVTLTNAGKLRTRGVEFDTALKVTPQLTLSANGAFSDAKFLNYLGGCYPGQPVSGTAGAGCYLDASSGALIANNAGQRLTNAPKWTYGLQASYNAPVNDIMQVDANVNWSWRSSTFGVVADPVAKTASYGIFNGSIGISGKDRDWRVGLYARNLFDKHFVAISHNPFDAGGLTQAISNDGFRTLGVSLDVKL